MRLEVAFVVVAYATVQERERTRGEGRDACPSSKTAAVQKQGLLDQARTALEREGIPRRNYSIDAVLLAYVRLSCEVWQRNRNPEAVRGFIRTTFVVLVDGACSIVVANPDLITSDTCAAFHHGVGENASAVRHLEATSTQSARDSFAQCGPITSSLTALRRWAAIVNKQDKATNGPKSAVGRFMARRACDVPVFSLGGVDRGALPCVMPAPFRDFFNERYEREESSFIEVLRLGTPLLDEKTWSRLVPAVFWRGKTGLQTGIDRNPLIRFSQTSGCAPNETCWLDARVVPNTQRGYVPPDLVRSKFASLEEWLRHRYIVDVDGFGYSSGLVWKLWTQRPVFRVTSSRNLSVWYDYFLRPWLNFVPVPPGDWLAARRAFDLLEAHPCLAMAIAANARRLACVLDLDFAARLLLTSVDARFYLVADAEAGDWGGGAQVPRPLVPLLTSSFPR